MNLQEQIFYLTEAFWNAMEQLPIDRFDEEAIDRIDDAGRYARSMRILGDDLTVGQFKQITKSIQVAVSELENLITGNKVDEFTLIGIKSAQAILIAIRQLLSQELGLTA